jgi:small subunit ribosomal protein S17
MENKKEKTEEATSKKVAASKSGKECSSRDCYVHGNLKVRGRTFQGTVTKKFNKRIVIENERMVRIRKYERYTKKRTKLHARVSPCMESEILIGDLVKIRECKPLSKIIHFVVVEKIRDADKEIKVKKRRGK